MFTQTYVTVLVDFFIIAQIGNYICQWTSLRGKQTMECPNNGILFSSKKGMGVYHKEVQALNLLDEVGYYTS